MIQFTARLKSKKLLSWASLSSLVERHEKFLNIARDVGDGELKLFEHNHYLEMVISNVKKRNALSGRMMFQLSEKLELIEQLINKDHRILALVIRGEGNESFCAGADLSFAQNHLNSPEKGYLMGSYMTEVLNKFRQLPIISICCINGAALGGGAEVATVGDFRIFGEKSFLQFVHARIGASPGWGGALRLCSIAGRRHALRLLSTSEKLSAEEARAIGLADFIAEPNLSWENNIKTFLEPYVKQPYPLSVRAMKQIVANSDMMLSHRDNIDFELATFRSRWNSPDNVEAVANALASLKTKS